MEYWFLLIEKDHGFEDRLNVLPLVEQDGHELYRLETHALVGFLAHLLENCRDKPCQKMLRKILVSLIDQLDDPTRTFNSGPKLTA